MKRSWLTLLLVLPLMYCGGPDRIGRVVVDLIDLAKIPENLSHSEWEDLMRPLDGRRVSAVGCAKPMRPTRKWSEGYVLWPCEFTNPGAAIAGDRSLSSSQILVVYPSSAERKRRPRTTIRVTGVFRLGMVSDGIIKWGWGRIEDATWAEQTEK